VVGFSNCEGAPLMSVQDMVEAPGALGAPTRAEPYSEAWWHERNTEELRLIMDRGPAMGASFDGATAEVERRARDRLRDQEQAAVTRGTRDRQIRRLILESLLLACLLIVVAVGLTR
jgi:hypothetical protein